MNLLRVVQLLRDPKTILAKVVRGEWWENRNRRASRNWTVMGRVSAKRTPSGGIRIFIPYVLDFSPLIPNWYLKNVYDLIGLKFSSSSAETLHCEV